jgi:hypothetical protein
MRRTGIVPPKGAAFLTPLTTVHGHAGKEADRDRTGNDLIYRGAGETAWTAGLDRM